MENGEFGLMIMVVTALVAGTIRGFTGFGGPAFMLAILTIFFTPLEILGKILVIDLIASVYLFWSSFRQTNWKIAAYLIVPTLVTLPIGQWILVEADPQWMRYSIAAIIGTCSILMLLGLRYRETLKPPSLIVIGALSGVVFGATYIALLVVAAILSGPYDKVSARSLIISWAFAAAIGYGVTSVASGATQLDDVWIALPGAGAYFFGAWLGSRWFVESAEVVFRRVALVCLLLLSMITLLL